MVPAVVARRLSSCPNRTSATRPRPSPPPRRRARSAPGCSRACSGTRRSSSCRSAAPARSSTPTSTGGSGWSLRRCRAAGPGSRSSRRTPSSAPSTRTGCGGPGSCTPSSPRWPGSSTPVSRPCTSPAPTSARVSSSSTASPPSWPRAASGRNCWINQQVTIGFTRPEARPVIGDDVFVYAGAKVLGDIRVGDGARVGAQRGGDRRRARRRDRDRRAGADAAAQGRAIRATSAPGLNPVRVLFVSGVSIGGSTRSTRASSPAGSRRGERGRDPRAHVDDRTAPVRAQARSEPAGQARIVRGVAGGGRPRGRDRSPGAPRARRGRRRDLVDRAPRELPPRRLRVVPARRRGREQREPHRVAADPRPPRRGRHPERAVHPGGGRARPPLHLPVRTRPAPRERAHLRRGGRGARLPRHHDPVRREPRSVPRALTPANGCCSSTRCPRTASTGRSRSPRPAPTSRSPSWSGGSSMPTPAPRSTATWPSSRTSSCDRPRTRAGSTPTPSLLLTPYTLDMRPRVVLEAQVNGIPVLANDLPALRETVGPGGVLVARRRADRAWVDRAGCAPRRPGPLRGARRRGSRRTRRATRSTPTRWSTDSSRCPERPPRGRHDRDRRRVAAAVSAPPPTLSVVIPAHDAAATLPAQLDALLAQQWTEPWEIVVVDNRSTDDTGARRRRATRTAIRASGSSRADARAGVAYCRNVGVGAARADAIAMCDADDVVAPGWVARHGHARSRRTSS